MMIACCSRYAGERLVLSSNSTSDDVLVMLRQLCSLSVDFSVSIVTSTGIVEVISNFEVKSVCLVF